MIRQLLRTVREYFDETPPPVAPSEPPWGSRIRLRRPKFEDVDALMAYATREEANAHTPYPLEDRDDVVELVQNAIRGTWDEHGEIHGFVMERLDTGEIVGDCTLMVDPGRETGYIGYAVSPDHWRNGYATEAVGLLLEFARHRSCRLVESIAYERNRASIRVLEKSGYSLIERTMLTTSEGDVRAVRMGRRV